MIEKYRDEVVSEEVGALVYTSTKFPATKGLELLARTVKILGARGLHAIVVTHAKELALIFPALLQNIGQPQTFDAIEQLALSLIEDINLPRHLLANTKVNKTRPPGNPGPVSACFDTHFAGEVPHLVSALVFVLKHNFVGFSDGSHLTTGSLTNAETDAESSSA